MKRLQDQRRLIRQGAADSDWSLIVSRDGFWQKVSQELRAEIDKWIRDHPHVIHSPIAKDTVLVKDDSTGELVRKTKLILQCSIRELHCDLYKLGPGLRDKVVVEGSNLVSDTMFRALLPKELRVMTNHYKEMCLCGVCHEFALLQSALNRCRTKHLTSLKKQWNDCPEKILRKKHQL